MQQHRVQIISPQTLSDGSGHELCAIARWRPLSKKFEELPHLRATEAHVLVC